MYFAMKKRIISHLCRLSIAAFGALTLSNCAIGESKIALAHSPVAATSPQRSGTVVVRTFTDSRKDIDRILLGNKRNGFGMVLGSYAIKGNKSVARTVTGHFADALTAAGYQVVVSDSASGGAVLTGDIHELWLDLYAATWANVGVNLQLKNGGRTVWSKNIEAKETNVLWVGVPSEIEKVLRQAMDKALAQAAQEFASDSFASKVR